MRYLWYFLAVFFEDWDYDGGDYKVMGRTIPSFRIYPCNGKRGMEALP
jgi:hypothetical protein